MVLTWSCLQLIKLVCEKRQFPKPLVDALSVLDDVFISHLLSECVRMIDGLHIEA